MKKVKILKNKTEKYDEIILISPQNIEVTDLIYALEIKLECSLNKAKEIIRLFPGCLANVSSVNGGYIYTFNFPKIYNVHYIFNGRRY